jgi:hypothetical protein
LKINKRVFSAAGEKSPSSKISDFHQTRIFSRAQKKSILGQRASRGATEKFEIEKFDTRQKIA